MLLLCVHVTSAACDALYAQCNTTVDWSSDCRNGGETISIEGFAAVIGKHTR